MDILTELINRVRAVVLSGKVDINLHWRSLEDEALGSQRMRFLALTLWTRSPPTFILADGNGKRSGKLGTDKEGYT